jgi:hypothetical protein
MPYLLNSHFLHTQKFVEPVSEWCVVQEIKRFAKSKSWIIFMVVNVYFKFFCDNRIENVDCGTFFLEKGQNYF